MKRIPLTQGLTAMVDDADYAALSRYRWNATWTDSGYYARRLIGKKPVYMHRVIIGVLPAFQVDHANKNTLDNRRANLRIVTEIQQRANQKLRRDSKSGYKGVRQKGSRFYARIKVSGREMHIGAFATATEAACAYNEMARKYYGQFAQVN